MTESNFDNRITELTDSKKVPPELLIGVMSTLKEMLPNLDMVVIIADSNDAIAGTTLSPQLTAQVAQGIIEKMKLITGAAASESKTSIH
ncbi:MAG: hypothetical protein V4621_07770 [Pseudomonadota bacterium]